MTYTVTFGLTSRMAPPPPYRVPSACTPVEHAGTLYELDHDARDAVVRLYEAAGAPAPSPSPAVPDGRALVDRRPAEVVLLDRNAESAPASASVDVAARFPGRDLEVVVYRSRGVGECATVTGPLDTNTLCRPSLRDALDRNGVVFGAVGPTVHKDGPSDDGGTVVAAAYA